METKNIDVDVENQPIKQDYTRTLAFVEAAGLLLLWSAIVINEGTVRLNLTQPFDDLRGDGRPPKMVPFLGALSEVFFGLIGFFLGLCALFIRYYNTGVMKIGMALQTLLGVFTFIIYVFVLPIYEAVDLNAFSVEGLSDSQSSAVVVMGLLTAFHLCLALQGGQFVFMARLVAAGTGTDFLKQKTGARMRAIFWNGNLAFVGLWSMIGGSIIVSNASEDGELSAPFVAPALVGTLPGFLVFTGLAILLFGVGSAALVATNRPIPSLYFLVASIVYLFGLMNYGIVQFGQFASPSGGMSIHNGLVLVVAWLGPYYMSLVKREEEDAAEEEKEH